MASDIDCVKKGTAQIKREYLYYVTPEAKKPKYDDSFAEKKDLVEKLIKEKKKPRGQNKCRYNKNRHHILREQILCRILIDVRPGSEIPVCQYPKCKDNHDIENYLSSKPPDIGNKCFLFTSQGFCPRGLTCRFGSEHISNGRNIVSKDYSDDRKLIAPGALSKDVQIKLRKRTYDFTLSSNITQELKTENSLPQNNLESVNLPKDVSGNGCSIEVEHVEEGTPTSSSVLGPSVDADRPNVRERKKIDWKNKLYLAPLTTLGNLPFRRICKEWGADVTCGEMAMATSILQGLTQEWALLRRHSSEDLFGVQLCGTNHRVLTRCVQIIEETTDVDFVDLNLGCPIELIYRKGGGSGLLLRENELKRVVQCMNRVSSIPLTVKTRSGVYDQKLVAHEQMPIYNAAGVSLITVHGRTREQRYTRNADWEYIDKCGQAAAPTPVFGSGDILSLSDYNHIVATYPNVSGVMIGRGALYKPWIFTEIKEQRDWDISSSERLDILRKFANYGFEHWGSDTRGVETTRRFLLEWLSFLYRYIPIGVLEQPPQRINERPPRYVGRDDLETLMASPNCDDWVKISEMLCGPVPEDFVFFPKHKANAWASESV